MENGGVAVIDVNPRGNNVKKVRLDEALDIAGFGLFNCAVVFVSGFGVFASMVLIIGMSYVVPSANCDFHLTSTEQGALTSMGYTGMIFSSHLFGYLADSYGRRYVSLRCAWVSSVLTIIAAFSQNVIMLCAVWFVNGFVLSGILTPMYVYSSECCAFASRPTALAMTAAMGALSTACLPVLANFILPLQFSIPLWPGLNFTSWRLLLLVGVVPMILCSLMLHLCIESPKFELTNGRHSETLESLRTMFQVNNWKPKSKFPVNHVYLDHDDTLAVQHSFWTGMWIQTKVLLKPPLLKYTAVSCFTNLGIVGMYNVIMLWLPTIVAELNAYSHLHPEFDKTLCQVFSLSSQNQTDSDVVLTCSGIDATVYNANIIIGAAQFILFCLSGTIVKYLGRKNTLVGLIFLSGVCCFTITLVKSVLLIELMLGVVVVFVAVALPVALSFVVDFFPTNNRSMATCLCMMCGRAGSSIGSQIFGALKESYCDISYYGSTAILFGIAVVCFFIPMKRAPASES